MAITWTKQDLGTYEDGSLFISKWLFSSSPDGQTVVANADYEKSIFVSYDGMISWNKIADIPIPLFYERTPPAVSNDGNIYFMGATYSSGAESILLSYDRNTDQYMELHPFSSSGETSMGIKCDSTGQYIIIMGYQNHIEPVIISCDFGNSWIGYFNDPWNGDTKSIYVNDDGNFMAVSIGSNTNSYIYITHDHGGNWSMIFNKTKSECNPLTMVSDNIGMNMVLFHAGFSPSYFIDGWVTHDFGTTWNNEHIDATGIDLPYGQGDMSNDGSTIIFARQYGNGYINSSLDYGDSWSLNYVSDVADSYVVYPSFIGTSKDLLLSDSFYGGNIYTSNDLAITCTQIKPYIGFQLKDYWHVASDATGTIFLAAGEGVAKYAYVSHNSGSTWEASPVVSGSSQDFTNYSIALMSSDGMYMMLQDYNSSRTYRSIDSGSTWTETTVPLPTRTYIRAAMSGNGRYIIVASQYTDLYMYISSDYGESWSTDSIKYAVSDVAINYMGSLMITTTNGTVRISRDYGLSWIDITDIIGEQTSYVPLASTLVTCDNSGQNIYLSDPYGYCFASHDSGYTWVVTPNFIVLPYLDYGTDIACSSTGGKIFWTSESDNTMVFSKNFGSTWSKDNYQAVEFWYTIGVNGAGTQILAGSQDGYVYLSSGEIFVGGGNIKSIGGVLFENIKKVSGVPIANLKKISGELN